MNQQPFDHNDLTEDQERRLQQIASAFPYPPTPDIAGKWKREQVLSRVRPRRVLLWAAVLLIILLCSALVVPPVRAAILKLLRIGNVIILPSEPTATPTAASSSLTSTTFVSPTSAPTITPIRSLLDLAGETTLAEAQAKVKFPIHLPAYPPDLGAPDRVYLQDIQGPVVILVWLDPHSPDGIKLSLHLLGKGALVYKMAPKILEKTVVNGHEAIWTEGPYVFASKRGNEVDWDMRRIINGKTLIWAENDVTYRLESYLSIEDAVRIAESLR
jgi:hypothetical protein